MLAGTMIPEAFDDARNWAGLITVVGFPACLHSDEVGRLMARPKLAAKCCPDQSFASGVRRGGIHKGPQFYPSAFH